MYFWADAVAQQMKLDEHFTFDVKKDKLEVTEAGRQLARYSSPPSGPHAPAMDKLHEAIEQALQANHRFRPRPALHGRRGQGGDHRREHRPADARPALARGAAPGGRGQGAGAGPRGRRPRRPITYQSYFRLYDKLAGMTGTASSRTACEVRRVYKLWVVRDADQPAGHAGPVPGPGVPDRGRQVRRDGAGGEADARGRPAGPDRHADAWRSRRRCASG